jgi:hypothetical protein
MSDAGIRRSGRAPRALPVCCVTQYAGDKPACSGPGGFEPKYVEEMTSRGRVVLVGHPRFEEGADAMCPAHFALLQTAYARQDDDELVQERTWLGWAVNFMRVRDTHTRATAAARPLCARPRARRRALRPSRRPPRSAPSPLTLFPPFTFPLSLPPHTPARAARGERGEL